MIVITPSVCLFDCLCVRGHGKHNRDLAFVEPWPWSHVFVTTGSSVTVTRGTCRRACCRVTTSGPAPWCWTSSTCGTAPVSARRVHSPTLITSRWAGHIDTNLQHPTHPSLEDAVGTRSWSYFSHRTSDQVPVASGRIIRARNKAAGDNEWFSWTFKGNPFATAHHELPYPLYPTLVYPTHPTLLYPTPVILLYSTLLYSTLLYSTLLYSTLLYSTLLYSTLLYSTLLYSTLL